MKKVTVRISDEDRVRLELEYPELTRYELREIADAAFEIASRGKVELSEHEIMNMEVNTTYHAEFDHDGEDYESITIEINEVELTRIESLKISLGDARIKFQVASTGTIYIESELYRVRISDHDANNKKNIEVDVQKASSDIIGFIGAIKEMLSKDDIVNLNSYLVQGK